MYPPFRGTYRILVHGGLRSDGEVVSEKICASSNSPCPQCPNPQQCPRLPHPATAKLPRAPSAPGTSNLHTWSLRRLMPTVWVACSRAASLKGQCEEKAEPLRTVALHQLRSSTTEYGRPLPAVSLRPDAPFSLLVFVRQRAITFRLLSRYRYRDSDTRTSYTLHNDQQSVAILDLTDCCCAPCLGPRHFRKWLCRMTWPGRGVRCDLSAARAAAGVRRKQEGSGDLEGVIRVRRTGRSDLLASGCANIIERETHHFSLTAARLRYP